MSTTPKETLPATAASGQQHAGGRQRVEDLLRSSLQSRQLDSALEPLSMTLQNLFDNDDASFDTRKVWLGRLGNGQAATKHNMRKEVRHMHEKLATDFDAPGDQIKEDTDILTTLQQYEDDKLKYLFTQGDEGCTILHYLLDPEAYDKDRPFHFDRLKPLIRFLIRLNPELPLCKATSGKGTPIFMALNPSGFSASERGEIVKFLCDKNDGNLGSRAAIESLGQVVSVNSDDDPKNSYGTHAIRKAIESSDFEISERIVRSLRDIEAEGQGNGVRHPCLEMCDNEGNTCLHVALRGPFNAHKIRWAEMLAELHPNLLKATNNVIRNGQKAQLTPLQMFIDEKALERQESKSGNPDKQKELNAKLEKLEDTLKRQCLMSFDNSTCRRIMYKQNEVKETFLTLDDDTISWEFLESQKQHYKLDTSLKRVQINHTVFVSWDDGSNTALSIAKRWRCAGSFDLFMVFCWLKDVIKVKKVLEVVVDDGAGRGVAMHNSSAAKKKPHSDQAIIECLKGLNVEILNWRRVDIPAEVLAQAAAQSVRTLYLYCSGLKAVLQSWGDRCGLLEEIHVEIDQGLESTEWIEQYMTAFKTDLEDTFKDQKRKSPNIVWIFAAPRGPGDHESSASKVKNKNEPGFDEQDWVKCMDEFADIMEAVEQPSNTNLNIAIAEHPTRVALIDDGVKTSYAGLDSNVRKGKSDWQRPESDLSSSTRTWEDSYSNYNSSHTGHGTVMAYYIRRVCPKVDLYVAKLEPEPQGVDLGNRGSKVTFSLDSAAQAIEWAIEQDVDIISMSWAVERTYATKRGDDQKEKRFRNAIWKAVEKKILLFCANPDNGPGFPTNNTYPKTLNDHVFCIGAATQDGVRWVQIHNQDDSCDLFLPGVELGIQVQSRRKRADEPPREWYPFLLISSDLLNSLNDRAKELIVYLGVSTVAARFPAPLRLGWQL
ncbi:subtilisin-like protein [Xylaria cf. heliscus]|nr:subtilisin-like protein [Xylaria cf. heliscus]